MERAACAGLEVDLGQKYFAAGLHVGVYWTDQGNTETLEGMPRHADLVSSFTVDEAREPVEETVDLLNAVAVELGLERLH